MVRKSLRRPAICLGVASLKILMMFVEFRFVRISTHSSCFKPWRKNLIPDFWRKTRFFCLSRSLTVFTISKKVTFAELKVGWCLSINCFVGTQQGVLSFPHVLLKKHVFVLQNLFLYTHLQKKVAWKTGITGPLSETEKNTAFFYINKQHQTGPCPSWGFMFKLWVLNSLGFHHH